MGHLKNLPKERRLMWENVFGDPEKVAGTEVDNMYMKKNRWDLTAYEKPDAVHEWGFWDEQIRVFIDFIYKSREE